MSHSPRKSALFVVFLTVFIDLLGFGIVLPLLPIYAREFTLDRSGVILGLLMASFSAMQFLFAPFWGRLSDRIGRRPVLMIGLSGSVVFYTIFGAATAWRSLFWMFVSRIGAGIAGATIPTAQAYIADVTSPENRARGMALIGAAFGLGFTLGPLLAATALISAGSAGLSPWPGYTAAGLSAVALILASFKLPESLDPNHVRRARSWYHFDALRNAVTVPTVFALLMTSFVSVLAFAKFESILAFLMHEPVDEGGFGMPLVTVLIVFALLGLVHALMQGVVRSLSGRMSEGSLATLGATICVGSYVLLGEATRHGHFGSLMAGMVLVGVGAAFLPPCLQAMISRRTDPAKQGGIMGVAQSLSALARILGHAIAFPLFYLGAAVPFWAGTGLMVVALTLILANAKRGVDFAAAAE
ncbi:MAG TPA: MFS transporter [Planctomycetaceae bacterium]|nr:MFS transporter [Planctomycetaceae bacterium]